MAASATASLDKKLQSLPLAVLQQIVTRHSIVLSEADHRGTVGRYLPNIKNEEEGAVVICRGFEVGADEDCADEIEPHPRGGWVEAELCEDARLLGLWEEPIIGKKGWVLCRCDPKNPVLMG